MEGGARGAWQADREKGRGQEKFRQKTDKIGLKMSRTGAILILPEFRALNCIRHFVSPVMTAPWGRRGDEETR